MAVYVFQSAFGDDMTSPGMFAETCADHYHWLREYAMDHTEGRSILRAIDWQRGIVAGLTGENWCKWNFPLSVMGIP
jgi:hypothetical protein